MTDGGTHPKPEEARDVIAQALDAHETVQISGHFYCACGVEGTVELGNGDKNVPEFKAELRAHRVDAYIAALAEAGYRVVRQEQVGWYSAAEKRTYYKDTDWRCFAFGKRPAEYSPAWVDSEPSETPT